LNKYLIEQNPFPAVSPRAYENVKIATGQAPGKEKVLENERAGNSMKV
jgi:hypothetical protein